LSSMNSLMYVSTRMMFSLSRAGYAPRLFGALNSHGVPLPALLLSSTGIAVAAIVTVVSPQRAYILMLSVGSFSMLFVWMMIFITYCGFGGGGGHNADLPPRFRAHGFPGDYAARCWLNGRGAGDDPLQSAVSPDSGVRDPVCGMHDRDLLDLVSRCARE